jgi:hypothetical protein
MPRTSGGLSAARSSVLVIPEIGVHRIAVVDDSGPRFLTASRQ